MMITEQDLSTLRPAFWPNHEHLRLIAHDPPTTEAFAGTCMFGHPAIVILAENSD